MSLRSDPTSENTLGVGEETASPTPTAPSVSSLPPGFDVEEWTRSACEASGVPFAVNDPLALRKLSVLTSRFTP